MGGEKGRRKGGQEKEMRIKGRRKKNENKQK